MFARCLIIAASALTAALCVVAGARAGEIPLSDDTYTVRVQSMHERRFSRVIHQQYDFSCGSAAVATLLTYSYDQPTSERDTFKLMYEKGDRSAITKVGFSLLDMQAYFAARGYHSDGYKLTIDQVRKIAVPGITLIKPNGYNHFVIIRGISDRDVLLGDPAQGLRRMRIDDFQRIWSGVVFYVKDAAAAAHRHFNDPADWALTPGAPLPRGMDIEHLGIGYLFVNLPVVNQF